METGALIHAPSLEEMASWRTKHIVIGVMLVLVAVTGVYIGIATVPDTDDIGSGGALVAILTVGASMVIGVFGLRYVLLGIRGRGLKLYQHAIEADFPGRLFVLPERRTVPLLRVELGGTARMSKAMAITPSGHAFPLPAPFVEKSDLWVLGSLGTHPVAPGGKAAKDRFDKGEFQPRRERTPEPIDHGPPWPEVPPLPKDIVVESTDAQDVPVEHPKAPSPPPARPIVPPPVPRQERPTVPPEVEVPDQVQPPTLGVPEALPDEPLVRPTYVRPPVIRAPPPVPEPPLEEITPPRPQGKEVASADDGWELEELPPPEIPAPAAPDVPDAGWELEEVPPPAMGDGTEVHTADGKEEKPTTPSGWDWEEL